MKRETLQLINLLNILQKTLNAPTEEQYEYWKKHFEQYLNKLYKQKINQTQWETYKKPD